MKEKCEIDQENDSFDKMIVFLDHFLKKVHFCFFRMSKISKTKWQMNDDKTRKQEKNLGYPKS